jgi:hypothetical protein
MALIIKSTEEKKIYIQGTEIELNEVYFRIEFICRQDGKNVEVYFYSYLNKGLYQDNKYLQTDIQSSNIKINLDNETEVQSLEVIHNKSKEYFETLGYECLIDL